MRRVGAVFFVTDIITYITLGLDYNLIRFTDICLKLSISIRTAKHDTALYQVMTRQLI